MTWYSTRELEAFRRQGFTVEGNLAGRPYIEKRAPNGSYERIYTDGGGPTRCAAVIFPKRPVAPSQDEALPATPQPQRKRPATAVRMSRAVSHKIARLAHTCDALESGGVLFGFVRADGSIEVTDARRANSKRTARSVEVDLNAVNWRLDGAQLVGEWHSHPSGDRIPSGKDLQAWDRCRELRPGRPWVSVIASWRKAARPLVTTYITPEPGRTLPVVPLAS